jgi:hypothetical protein
VGVELVRDRKSKAPAKVRAFFIIIIHYDYRV